LVAVVKNIKQKYPNCKIVYCSSRTYGGYETTSLNPEPYAYESGFSVKWLIEKQIVGDTSLVCIGTNPKAPWLSWGPYLWANGINPRSDGLIWLIDDFVTSDRTHPSASGQKKVADLLLNFLKTDLTARNWFLKKSFTSINEIVNSRLNNSFYLYQNYPNPFNPNTVIQYWLTLNSHITLKVYDVLGREVAALADEFKTAGIYNLIFNTQNFSLSSGVYFYRLTAGNFSLTKAMNLIK